MKFNHVLILALCLIIVTNSTKSRIRKSLYSFLNNDVDQDKAKAKNSTDANITIPMYEVVNITNPLFIIPSGSPNCNENWNYKENGNDWECQCKEGKAQSPIDLPAKDKATLSPIKPLINFEVIKPEDNFDTIDKINEVKNGDQSDSTIKLRYHNEAIKLIAPNLGKIVKIDGSVYLAEEVQFHTPSEHTISGERFDLEMQVIYYGRTQGDIAKQIVLSFLFKKTPGKYNKFIDSLDFYSLPNPTERLRELYNNLYIPNVFYNSDDDEIPVIKPFSFYTYEGSLTSPPCTERTTHYVVSEPIALSSTAIELFREALRKPDTIDSKGNFVVDNSENQNNRSIQPLNNREVFFFDHSKFECPIFQKKKNKQVEPSGHYEKRLKDVTEYFYVNSKEPTGIPGSYVVSESEAKGLTEKEKLEENLLN